MDKKMNFQDELFVIKRNNTMFIVFFIVFLIFSFSPSLSIGQIQEERICNPNLIEAIRAHGSKPPEEVIDLLNASLQRAERCLYAEKALIYIYRGVNYIALDKDREGKEDFIEALRICCNVPLPEPGSQYQYQFDIAKKETKCSEPSPKFSKIFDVPEIVPAKEENIYLHVKVKEIDGCGIRKVIFWLQKMGNEYQSDEMSGDQKGGYFLTLPADGKNNLKYYIQVEDDLGNLIDNRDQQLEIKIDRTPPTIDHQPLHALLKSLLKKEKIGIEATVEDDTGLERVTLNWRPVGWPNQSLIEMTNDGGIYRGEIYAGTAEIDKNQGVEYTIIAQDKVENKSMFKVTTKYVPRYRRPWAWVSTGIGIAGFSAAVVLFREAEKIKDDYNAKPVRTEEDLEEAKTTYDNLRRWAWISLLGVGPAASGGAFYLFSRHQEIQTPLQFSYTPQIQASHAGITLSYSF